MISDGHFTIFHLRGLDLGISRLIALFREIYFKHELTLIRHGPDFQILQGNMAFGFLVLLRGEVIHTVVGQDEPAFVPGLMSATLLGQPSVSFRIDEGQTVASFIVGQLESMLANMRSEGVALTEYLERRLCHAMV